jgi:hypothetical protein
MGRDEPFCFAPAPPNNAWSEVITMAKRKKKGLVSLIIAYESGELGAEDTLRLFSRLIKSGLAWQLQGHYGRVAASLIEQGIINKNGRINWKSLALM